MHSWTLGSWVLGTSVFSVRMIAQRTLTLVHSAVLESNTMIWTISCIQNDCHLHVAVYLALILYKVDAYVEAVFRTHSGKRQRSKDSLLALFAEFYTHVRQ